MSTQNPNELMAKFTAFMEAEPFNVDPLDRARVTNYNRAQNTGSVLGLTVFGSVLYYALKTKRPMWQVAVLPLFAGNVFMLAYTRPFKVRQMADILRKYDGYNYAERF
mmetsp:Transcript_43112/g.49546  ORF Transcript_43112/g.49546 Transcript_43112/m.49546 type:complete len:108 (+) Transcript_43112:55-378(+)